MPDFVSSNKIRSMFSSAMSNMYRLEVPVYADLIDIVGGTNSAALTTNRASELNLDSEEDLERISDERHGAIRVGTAAELSMIRRIFKIMGMHPVSYYDLSVAGIPVHSTAFRPIERAALASNPFRVFTSLLRLELIEDEELREIAKATLEKRNIFTGRAIELVLQAEKEGGLDELTAPQFVKEVLETFRWADEAIVTEDVYKTLHDTHRLIADVVGFQGPHINHLTPRTLDIDATQQGMINRGLPAKAVIEGPPKRHCPILLRQTSFKALEEKFSFVGSKTMGTHTARFGEIEERGVALTSKGRVLYDELLNETRAKIVPAADGSNSQQYVDTLNADFTKFPDNWRDLHNQGLAYFRYKATGKITGNNVTELLGQGALTISPIIYEDFLPVSAAGIFQSNLGDGAKNSALSKPSREQFIQALGAEPADEFAIYQAIQDESLERALNNH